VRLLAFSDVHRDVAQCRRLVEMSEQADVVIAAGDFASVHRGLEETIDALSAIARPTVLVPGNNETEEALRSACAGWPAATVLHGESAVIGGVSFFGLGAGVPVTPWDWSFDLSDEDASALLVAAPAGGVFVIHSPPKGHLDNGLGSEAILRAIEEKRPAVVVCGHVHECAGRWAQIGPTRLLNAGPSGTLLGA
jgi:Icc-related predicted phosphoesterase